MSKLGDREYMYQDKVQWRPRVLALDKDSLATLRNITCNPCFKTKRWGHTAFQTTTYHYAKVLGLPLCILFAKAHSMVACYVSLSQTPYTEICIDVIV